MKPCNKCGDDHRVGDEWCSAAREEADEKAVLTAAAKALGAAPETLTKHSRRDGGVVIDFVAVSYEPGMLQDDTPWEVSFQTGDTHYDAWHYRTEAEANVAADSARRLVRYAISR